MLRTRSTAAKHVRTQLPRLSHDEEDKHPIFTLRIKNSTQ